VKSLIGTILAGVLVILGAGYLGSLEFAQQNPSTQGMSRLEIEQKREEWFYRQRAYPNKHIPPGARLKALKQLGRMLAAQREARKQQTKAQPSTAPAPSTTSLPGQWIQTGPEPASFWDSASVGGSSGRATAVVVDPRNYQVVYLGTAGGGVWKTKDGGQNWTPLTDNQPSLAIGSLALDPSNPDIIYAGTGEENFSGDSYSGAGVLKSTDAGASWTVLASGFVGTTSHIGPIAVDPSNGQVVLAAVGTFGGSGPLGGTGGGIIRSSDGGTSWTTVIPGMSTAVLFDPANGNTAYAALGYPWGAANNGVYKSIDGGQNWIKVLGPGTNFLALASLGRIGVAIDPTNPQTLYTVVANPIGSPQGDKLGVFKTTDGGQTWTQLATPPECCSWYENGIAVDPANPSVIFTGAGGISRSIDGGSTWTNINQTGSNGIAPHPDQHAFAFSTDGSVLYAVNDGGAWSTTDIDVTTYPNWNDLNATLATINFYPGLSISPLNPNLAFGGTQDTGSLRYTGSLVWDFTGVCGDAGYTAVDSSSPANVYINCATSGGAVNKSPSNGDPYTFASASNGIDTSDGWPWVAPIVLDPSNQSTLYFGGNHYVYQSTDGATSWTKLSTSFTANVSTIAVAPNDSNKVYVGTGDGHVYVTTNATAGVGAIWTGISTGLPNRWVSRIAVDPARAATAYVTLSGFSGQSNPSAHIFKTTDGGTTWADISGNLPDIPVNTIVIDPDLTSTLYAATDIGVFYTADGGATWYPLMDGLPNVVVQDLKLQEASRTLRASTHGRSMWDLALPSPLAPGASLSPSQVSFSPQIVDTTGSSQTVTLSNTGNAILSISAISASDQFSETNDCGSSLAAGGTCSITVSFTPSAGGAQNGTLNVTDDAAGSPQTSAVAGTGEDFALGTASGASDSATVTAGKNATYNLSVSPEGGFNQAVSLSCGGAPLKSTCSVSPASITLDGTNSATAQVTVTTTASSLVLPRDPLPPPESGPKDLPLLMGWLIALGALATLAAGGSWGKPGSLLPLRALRALAGQQRQGWEVVSRAVLAAVLTLVLMWAACGGGSGSGGGGGSQNPGTTSGNYSLTVTGTYTSGSTILKHDMVLKLTVG
jgi:photosystem II stability/assembly factor-like uncharacterized protein